MITKLVSLETGVP